MKAIGTIDSSKNFIDFEIEKPILRPHDLLIKV
ncbi:MAG TPA: zinc-binding alcohol dehydrogenase family protein, partial [Lactococcus lactis]|nr:zinc-binding alcohol dehydrogenase family protein [Lactococcus lactis]